jgi:hypothetical protein
MIPQAREGGRERRRRATCLRLEEEEEEKVMVVEAMILAVTLKLQHHRLVLVSNLQNSMSQIYLLLEF